MKIRTFTAILLVALAVIAAACGTPASQVTQTSTPRPTLGNNLISNLAVAAQSGVFQSPLDATPDPQGTTIYFTASGQHGAGVFRVPSAGGTVTQVFAGTPFVTPRALVVSPDGKLLYITDPGAGGSGQIFVLATNGGEPTPLPGSAGTQPQNLDIVSQGGQQVLYFSGKDPSNGKPAVLTLPVTGAQAPTVIAEGSPFVDPDGVVVTGSGTIYLSDRSAVGDGFGKVFKIEEGIITPIVDKVHTGDPAGIALTPDESILLISAVQPTTPSAEVLLVNLSTLQTGLVTKVISQNQGSGGLHASPGDKNVFAWAGKRGGSDGFVYQIVA